MNQIQHLIQSSIQVKNDLLENKLDVASLFKADMEILTPAETACLRLIAQRAPVDWFEIIEVSGPETLRSLIDITANQNAEFI